ncbi:MAG: autoinducer binding domain-containing protein [Rhodobacteraceae bacterium]|nr:autoinducer binding domain-containing protein [Paracoccaceae bacterium]
MNDQEKISAKLTRLRDASPAGFAIALHVRFTSPKYLFQSYEKDWLDTYSREGLVLHDPVVRWGFANDGTIRWSELDDPAGVMQRSRSFGMNYGAVIALVRDGSRSMGGFSRSDREMTDAEIEAIRRDLTDLHDLTARVETLAPSVHNALKTMSIFLTHG